MKWPRLLTLAALACLPTPSLCSAGSVPIVIDGNLADLETAIAANLGASKGGNICTDATGEIGSAQCTYYVNGFDLKRFLILVDPLKNPDGTLTGDVDVYVGWDAVGKIGDVDGNGNPDTFTPGISCASSDQPGIGSFESYVVDFDFNCDGIVDARFRVTDNKLTNFFTGAGVPGGEFAYVNNTLEAKIPILKVNAAPFDFCDMRIMGEVHAQFDHLAADPCQRSFTVAFDPLVSVTETPDSQTSCSDSLVSWTITVRNTGPCNLDEVNVQDVLDVGMSYVSDDHGSTGGVQTRNWTFNNLPAGQSIVIHLTAQLAAQCAAPTMNNTVTVQARHNSSCREIPGTTAAEDVAGVDCSTDCGVPTQPKTWGRIKAERR